MEARFTVLKSTFILIMVGVSLVLGGNVWAKSAALENEKAKLISQFAKYVKWPENAIKSKFIIGVHKNNEQYELFKEYFANKGVKGKDILVRSIDSFQDAKDLNILYISSSKKSILQVANRSISGRNILIVTENSNDIINTMVDFKFDDSASDLIFNVNYANLISEEITFPELSTFSKDKDNKSVLSESPSFLVKQQQEEELQALQNLVDLQKQIEQQETSLAQLNRKLVNSEANVKKYSADLKTSAKNLIDAQEKNTKQSQQIKSKNKQIQTLDSQLQAQIEQLKMNKGELQVASDNRIEEQELAIADLTEKLNQQKAMTTTKNDKLAKLSKSNKALSSFETLLYVFVVISIISLVIAVVMWRKSKQLALQGAAVSNYEDNTLLPIREEQLIKSENFAALGYIATDITYAIGLSLADFQDQLEKLGDSKNIAALTPMVNLLENFNIIAADQDDTEFQNFNVIAYIEKMMMVYDFEFKQSDITYNYSGEKELSIRSIPSYIALVLLNIINNAIKHGFDNKGNGEISLNVEKGAKGGAKIRFTDNGKGMNKATLSQVFTKFFTTHSDRGYVGVGMSTAYDLVTNKLSGDIKVESVEGKSTTITITLP